MAAFDVSVEIVTDAQGLDPTALRALAERVLTGEALAKTTGLAIVLIDDEEMRRLNKEFLGHDETTDVLSFPDDAGEFVRASVEEPYLGDIAISVPTALRQAEQLGHPLEREMAHLVVHGILHLCGFDHENGGEEERRMREREQHYLGDLGAFHSH